MPFNTVVYYLLFLLGFFIPVSTGAVNILVGLIFLFWILENARTGFSSNRRIIVTNPVAGMAMLVFLVFVAGTSYSSAPWSDIMEYLRDAAKFLFIPVVMIYAVREREKNFFLSGFLSAMILVLLLSWLVKFDLVPDFIPVKGNADNCIVFFNHIAQNIFMAYTAFFLAVLARFAKSPAAAAAWGVLSMVALVNVFFLVLGRTGHLVAAVLLVYFFLSLTLRSPKRLAAGALVILLLGFTAWFYPSNALVSRAKDVITEVREWEYQKPAADDSSSGLRLEYFFNTLKLVKQNPVFGTGTGSFRTGYHDLVKKTRMDQTDNPHNDYLLIAVQFGVTGLLVLLIFFWTQWRCAAGLKRPRDMIAARGFVLTIMVSCMVSSPLKDNVEGWFFAFMSAVLFAGASCRYASVWRIRQAP